MCFKILCNLMFIGYCYFFFNEFDIIMLVFVFVSDMKFVCDLLVRVSVFEKYLFFY